MASPVILLTVVKSNQYMVHFRRRSSCPSTYEPSRNFIFVRCRCRFVRDQGCNVFASGAEGDDVFVRVFSSLTEFVLIDLGMIRMGWKKIMPFHDYDERWKQYRRYANMGFSKKVAVQYHAGQTKDIHVFLQRLLANPDDFIKEFNM